MTFELSNAQRKYFGLDPLGADWDWTPLKQGHPTEGYLVWEGAVIKRHIVSTDFRYAEYHYNELTRDRTILLPKTSKGKEKKLSSSVLGQRQPTGVYLEVSNRGVITIGSYATQTTFYSTRWDVPELPHERNVEEIVAEFISQSPPDHLSQIEKFSRRRRRRVRFKSGDHFSFKLSRTEYGFGRVLLDINKIRKSGVLPGNHGLNLLMGPPVLVQLFAFKSPSPKVDIAELDLASRLPSDVMMDNVLLYGEYELIGHRELRDSEFEFPISYGQRLDRQPFVFLQWGLIHRELPLSVFDKFLVEDNFVCLRIVRQEESRIRTATIPLDFDRASAQKTSSERSTRTEAMTTIRVRIIGQPSILEICEIGTRNARYSRCSGLTQTHRMSKIASSRERPRPRKLSGIFSQEVEVR